MKRAMFLVEVELNKAPITDHADKIAGRIYTLDGTKDVTVWQIDPMDSTSFRLAQSIVDSLSAKTTE